MWKNLKLRHQRIHTAEKAQNAGKVYQCAKCGKNFKLKEYLQTPSENAKIKSTLWMSGMWEKILLGGTSYCTQITHTGERPYECLDYGRTFSTLKNHQRIHTGEKMYECPDSGKCFQQKEYSQAHQRIHTGEGSVENLFPIRGQF